MMRFLATFVACVTTSAGLLATQIPFSQGSTLRLTRQGTFQIAVFEDLHFGENAWEAWGPEQDLNSVKVLNQVLDAEDQQLVVLNGDLITSENAFLHNSTVYVDQIVAPMVKRGLPWASTYGNHDSNFNLSREHILAHERRYSNARTTQMVFDRNAGVSNYYLEVFPHAETKTPALILWFFDSRGGSYFQRKHANSDGIEQPNWVDQTVVDWFIATNKRLTRQYGRIIPSLAFVHIPTNASQALQTEAGVDPHHQPGINDDYILAQQAQGWCPDGSRDGSCGYGGQDVPFMRAIASTPGLLALFSGHDHGDTWCYRWKGRIAGVPIEGTGTHLCFGQRSGYGGYGDWTRGARQILVNESMLAQNSIETWIRLETGQVVGKVTLNETYNHDQYSSTPNTHS